MISHCTRSSFFAAVLFLSTPTMTFADSALPLLSGFDAERIEASYPADTPESVGELGKLIYRLKTLDTSNLSAKASELADQLDPELGDVIAIEGEIESIRVLQIPQRLVEFLEINVIQEVTLVVNNQSLRVITTKLPSEAKPGDRASGVGVVIERATPDAGLAIATARLGWFPKSPVNVGWKILGGHGVDVSALAEVGSRHRRPLMAEDGDAFYSMLAASDAIGRDSTTQTPITVEPVSLLREPENFAGQWMRMTLETVQVTRVSVTEPSRQVQLGSDHYFQIDAVGDLGNVVVQIEAPPGSDGETVLFENRYPVSLVMKELPKFLEDQIRKQEGGDAVVAGVTMAVSVDGFFFRLWSYSTDYMQQRGGGDQFGPLLVAARMTSRETTSDDPAGVGIIGWIAAIAVFAAILAIWSWHGRVTQADELVRQKRQERESEQIELPPDV